ncbi:MAG: hypothetical protein QXU67_06620, partial [Candidatus Bathyarchaeia archaeon]
RPPSGWPSDGSGRRGSMIDVAAVLGGRRKPHLPCMRAGGGEGSSGGSTGGQKLLERGPHLNKPSFKRLPYSGSLENKILILTPP